MKRFKAGILLFFSFSVFAAQQLDVSKAHQMCANATAQQKQMAKAAGYDLDALCAQLQTGSQTSNKLEQPEVVKPRGQSQSLTSAQQHGVITEAANPLSLFTPEQIAAMTPAQLARILEQIEQKAIEDDKEPLKPFGYDLFAGEPTTFAPATQIPVPANYVIGPGDTFEIQLYGKTSQQLSLMVNRNGQVNFPELGPISLAGLSFDEAKNLLQTRIKKQMIGVQASITLGELRSMQVFVLGEAYQPGSYTVSSLSTITNALIVSGGISDIGSLRDIQLKRQGKRIASLDLYDLLLKGDTSNDLRLLPGDVIYIPPVGKTVSIEGAIKRPAIYELKQEKTVAELVAIAGGLKPTAYRNEAQLARVNDDGFMTMIQVDRPDQSSLTLKAGDHLLIRERVEVSRGSVKLSGHVFRPKQVAWRPGLRVSHLIPSLDVLKPMPQLDSAILVRETMPLRTLTIELVNLKQAVTQPGSAYDTLLKAQDELIILGLTEDREQQLESLIEKLQQQASSSNPANIVSVSGLVRFPGVYPLGQGMSVKQLVELAGGFAESAYTLNGEVTRIDLTNPEQTQVKHFAISFTEQGDESFVNFKLKSRDVVNIRQRPEYREFALVEVKGEVKFPGMYRIKKGESLSDLMKRVGGFTEYAHVEAAVFTREELKEREEKQLRELREKLKADIANAQLEQSNVGKATNLASLEQLSQSLDSTQALGRLVIDIKSILAGRSQDVILKDGDTLIVPALRQEVSVVGEVQHPASHMYDPYLTFEEYIERSGGETEKADDERIYIVKADGSVVLPYKSGWVNALGVQIEPGDTIVVPLDVNAMNDLALWTQVSQIVYQIAIGAAAIARL